MPQNNGNCKNDPSSPAEMIKTDWPANGWECQLRSDSSLRLFRRIPDSGTHQAPVVLRLQLQIKGRQICRNVVQAQSLDNDLQAFQRISQFKITWFLRAAVPLRHFRQQRIVFLRRPVPPQRLVADKPDPPVSASCGNSLKFVVAALKIIKSLKRRRSHCCASGNAEGARLLAPRNRIFPSSRSRASSSYTVSRESAVSYGL